MGGTASRARRWVLLEQPGAWGADALTASDLPRPVAERLRELARTLPARVLLLRRTGGAARLGTERALFVGRSHAAGGWLEQLDLADVHDLLDLDLSPVATGQTVGGARLADPLYLVCTNGKHDPCCAQLGLPVARALAELVDDRVWECSHVGGDRFAGNVVCLPDGVFYGRLDPDTARLAVAAHEGGRLLLEHLRGRSALPFAAQAAEGLARRHLGVDRLTALRAHHVEQTGALCRVTFTTVDDQRVVATVRVSRPAEATALTCRGDTGRAPTYELVHLDGPSPTHHR